MQINQLRYFVALSDTAHFTQAAAQLGVTQPSLSQQIKALENSVGSQLVHRTRSRIELTEAGAALLPIARRILADIATAEREILALNDLQAGQVRLGATPSLCTGLLPPMLMAFRRDHPNIQLHIREGGSHDLRAKLSEGALDLALVIDSPLTDDHVLEAVPLLTEELVVVSALHQPRPVPRPRIHIRELRGRPLVMFREGYDLREATLKACRAEGFEPTLAIEGGEMDAVLEFVGAGAGIAVVPTTVVRDRLHRTPIALPGMSRTVSLAHRRGITPTRAAQALHDTITRFLGETAEAGLLPAGVRPI
ncbi:LysR family transcriptional regulator [Amycolatopsis xylanica]|uniref:LysR family transcriptional regulator n=1 Tax=Amycolatopsis xylanica TaxID=589385 RepID=UPI000B82FECF|nr:LysR substrate-binding domain-containing protein [Amycolatopsis xylanica]